MKELIEALKFYADPDTYFAIGFFPDHPCGDFAEDFDDTGKPGALARKVLSNFPLEIKEAVNSATTNKQSESLKCRCGADLPSLCNTCFVSEGFQQAQGSL